MPADVKQIINNNKVLNAQNDDWRSYWQDLGNFFLPRKSWITTQKTKGERLNFDFLFDSTGIRGLQIMAAGFHYNIDNPATKWFALAPKNQKLKMNQVVRDWFYEVDEIILSTLNGTNHDSTKQEFYTDAGCFGTGAIFTQRHLTKKVCFSNIPMEQLNFEEDVYGKITAVYRNFKLTPMQAWMLWGKKAGKSVVEIIEDYEKNGGGKAYIEMEFLHYIGPRDRRDFTKKDSMNMEYESVWIAKKDQHLIDEAGFKEMPYQIGRFWKDANDVMGFSPCMNVLADVKLLNAAKKTTLRRAMKEADPPVEAPSRGFINPINLNPAYVNMRDPKTPTDQIKPLIWNSNFSITKDFIEEVKKNVEEGLFVPLFRAISDQTKQMTIPEIQRRVAENMVLLGPVVGRFTGEVDSPLIVRVFNMLWEDGLLPPPPGALQGQDFEVEYLGNLAKAQKQSEISGVDAFVQRVASVGQVKPEVYDKIDEDVYVDLMAEMGEITPKLLRSDKDVKDIRDKRQKAQEMAARMEQMHKAAAVGKTVGEAANQFAGAKKE